jgi:hypothetical protein
MSAQPKKRAPVEGKKPGATSNTPTQPRYPHSSRRARLIEFGLKKLRLKKAWLQKQWRRSDPFN